MKTTLEYSFAISPRWLTAIGRSFIVLRSLTISFALQQQWILSARFNTLHIRAKCWLQGLEFLLIKTSKALSSFPFKSNFFERDASQFFLLRKQTIVILFDLPNQWQSSMSSVLMLTSICWKVSTTTISFNLSLARAPPPTFLQTKVFFLVVLLKFTSWNWLVWTTFSSVLTMSQCLHFHVTYYFKLTIFVSL